MIVPTRSASSAEKAQAAYALIMAVLEKGVASTDDAHGRYELPVAVDQRAWGAITMRLIAEGVLHRVGDTHTRRFVAHGRRIGLYYAPDQVRAQKYATRLCAISPVKQCTLFD